MLALLGQPRNGHVSPCTCLALWLAPGMPLDPGSWPIHDVWASPFWGSQLLERVWTGIKL